MRRVTPSTLTMAKVSATSQASTYYVPNALSAGCRLGPSIALGGTYVWVAGWITGLIILSGWLMLCMRRWISVCVCQYAVLIVIAFVVYVECSLCGLRVSCYFSVITIFSQI